MSAAAQAVLDQTNAGQAGASARPGNDGNDAAAQQPSGYQDPHEALLNKHGAKLIQLITKTRNGWEWKRRGIVLKVLKNKEMLKGNHLVGFYPGSYDSFDALTEYYNFTGANQQDDDRSMDHRPHNFYQMLEKAFVAALSAQIPKSRWLPENADKEEDREMAKNGSRVEAIIERANKIKGMVKQELMELFTSGCYFKYTRYVVDGDRFSTHKETRTQMAPGEVLPSRYVCFQCGTVTPEAEMTKQQALACPNCGKPLSAENFFEDHADTLPSAEEQDNVPNGMVLQTVYGPMHVDADPDAADLLNTGLLDVSEEVSLGWLRTNFPKMWKKFDANQTPGNSNAMQERQYRSMLTAPAGYSSFQNYSNSERPTYSRTWCQPMLFAEMENQADAEELKKAFPDGCMLAWTGEVPLQLRPAKLTAEWTWCGSEPHGFGLFPPPVGDPAVPVQERINDCVNKIDEYMDRLACGILLANERYVDTKAMNGKAMLPGLLNGIAFQKNAPPNSIQDAIFQVKAEIDAMIFTYVATLKQDMQLLVGTAPQTFGAGTQEGVETASGQQQQLNTGMMKLGLNWDSLREEHSEAAENAVNCAAKNMTEDWMDVVTDETKDFRNEFVHLDQMKGSVHAEPETDQGFPMTYAEIKQFYQDMMNSSDKEIVAWLMSEPANIDNAIRYAGVPGLVAPGGAMRTKMLRIIERLAQSEPTEMADPETGEPIKVPSLQPNKYLDDLGASQKLIETWSQEHWDKLENNQAGLDNLVAYYQMCVVYAKELEAEKQLTAAAGAPDNGNGQPQAGAPAAPPQPAAAGAMA